WEQHCCVVAVQVFDVLFKENAVFDGRLGKQRLKRLTIVMDPDECPFRVRDLAKHIGWMAIDAGVELRFIDGVYRLDAGESLLLALLGHLGVKLTVLDLTGLAVEAAVAERIVDALLQNGSVTDLAATLRRLYLDAYDMTEESNSPELWATLVQAIGRMTALEELVARGLRGAADIGLFGSVLVSNNSLRVLEVWGRPCCDQGAHPEAPAGLGGERNGIVDFGLERALFAKARRRPVSVHPRRVPPVHQRDSGRSHSKSDAEERRRRRLSSGALRHTTGTRALTQGDRRRSPRGPRGRESSAVVPGGQRRHGQFFAFSRPVVPLPEPYKN
ncbi:hypothetical protein MTO96_020445, partial [Rhipicephalus appendiculatus]